jgi:REP element-mobilizing transposase RayT
VPRRPRTELAGAVHHVTAKTPSGRILFYDDRDWERYLRLLAREVRERKWRVLTFCLMTNHVHLLVRTPDPDLGAGFKHIHENFARTLNDRHEQQGHVFGSRFYSGLVRSDRHLMGCLRYIARNPVRHGACRQPRDWPWSAHRALAGLTDPPELLDRAEAYTFLGANAEEARFNYLRLVAQTDDALLSELAAAGSDRWLVTAVDSYLFSVPQIANFLAIGRSTAYKRLAAARETVGTDP